MLSLTLHPIYSLKHAGHMPPCRTHDARTSWVIVQYLEGAAQVAVPYVALVKFFVRVADPCTGRVAHTAPMCARKPMGAGKPAGRDGHAHVANMSRLVHRDYAVAITQVQRKLCCTFEIKYMYFMETLVQTTRT